MNWHSMVAQLPALANELAVRAINRRLQYSAADRIVAGEIESSISELCSVSHWQCDPIHCCALLACLYSA